MARKAISQKTRFEIFKRDKFTCQYCGQAAPDVVLHVDHIQPVAGGGKNDVLNLITSCAICNGGKGARPLTDSSVVERQRAQIQDLEERRQQLEMMLNWRNGLRGIDTQAVEAVAEYIGANHDFEPNEVGKRSIKKWLRTFTPEQIMDAVDGSYETYGRYADDKITIESWGKAFSKVQAVARVQAQQKDKPYLRDLFYIQGIVRKTTGDSSYECIESMEAAHLAGVPLASLTRFAKAADDTEDFEDAMGFEVSSLKRQRETVDGQD